MNKVEAIILHNSGGIAGDSSFDTSQQSLVAIDSWHAQLGFPISERGFFIGYHFVCGYGGNITKTRNESEEGYHVIGMNSKSLGILIQGNFDRLPVLPNSKPTKEQEESLKSLLKELRQKYPNVPIRGHRYYANRTCPGKNLPDNYGEILIKEPEIATNNTTIATLEARKLDLMAKIIATLKLILIRWQNRLGGQKYD